jgi:DNA-binding transcriptional MerR regulator
MGYSIKEVSEKLNLSPDTLRYYEKEGLFPAIQRGSDGKRLYDDTDLERIQLVCCMRTTGMSIVDIKGYIDLCKRGEATVPERLQIIFHQKEIITNHIREYQKFLEIINKKLEYYNHITAWENKCLFATNSPPCSQNNM